MSFGTWSKRAAATAAVLALLNAGAKAADDGPQATDITAELNALKARIAELESQQHENWLTAERQSQIRGIVEDVLKDARTRGQFADGVETGYKDGFYIQTPDKNYKLTIGGFVQVRYEFTQSTANNSGTLPGTRSVGSSGNVTVNSPGNSSGIDVRRARVNFAGNVFSPDLTFKLEGDFYGGSYVNSVGVSGTGGTVPAISSGGFTVTDAFVAYRFNDQFKIKAGSYKAPFAKAELVSDTSQTFMEREEVLSPFDPVRALGVSLYGDIIKDTVSYEVAINNGGNGNLYRRADTVSGLANIDNRPAFYGRVQWAGNGKISDFADESDLRADNRDFVWLLGGAAGYESQTADIGAFPAPQTSTTVPGLSNGGTNQGFANAYVLNGDIFRGTLDWSAKYQGLSVNTAGYFQQVNVNPGRTGTTASTTPTVGPFGAGKSSFFEYGGYGQVGYFVLPLKNGRGLELVGRAGIVGTEGYHNIGEFYSVGANYYIFGQNFKVQSDVTFTPESPYTDTAAALLQNTHDVTFRLQLQVKF
ncbi:MAG TPA: porin [Phycisphaerae bacterium]|nr:porin [Phycisphaerae bacterium]